MKIIILGGGITGLTAAYLLAQQKHQVFLYEKQEVFGGLASGFKGKDTWEWGLERAYHHVFSNDNAILTLAKEVGFEEFYFQEPQTVSLYDEGEYNYRTIPVDTPQDFLAFPYLSIPEKIRGAAVLAFLKVSPFLSYYEKHTASAFLRNTMGERMWIIFWEQLFRKKFGKHAEHILASFIWARINKRTKKLGYIRGGFQRFIDHLSAQGESEGATLCPGVGVERVAKKGGGFVVTTNRKGERELNDCDIIISTLPTPILNQVARDVIPHTLYNKLSNLQYLSAVNLILESEMPLFQNTYWINVCDKKLPIMCIVQHTNLVDRINYGNKHLVYIANYVEDSSPLLKMNKEQAIQFFLPHLKKIRSNFVSTEGYLFKAPFAQPIFNKEFVQNMPTFETGTPHFYIANLDMTYPYDRGTNYAVKLGREVARLI